MHCSFLHHSLSARFFALPVCTAGTGTNRNPSRTWSSDASPLQATNPSKTQTFQSACSPFIYRPCAAISCVLPLRPILAPAFSRLLRHAHTPAHTPVPVSLRPLQISATMQNARPRATTAARPWRLGRRPRARTATFPSALGKPVGTMMRACIVAASPSREWQSGNWGFRAARRGVSLLYTI